MTPTTRNGSAKGAAVDFAEARHAAERAGVVQQRQAARRVAEHSRDVDDCRDLLLMLGLSGAAASREPRSARPVQDQPVNLTFPDPQPVSLTFPDALSEFRSAEGIRR